MPDRFFDTNVLLYLASTDHDKARHVEDLLLQGGTISVQVLSEIVNVSRRKMRKAWGDIREFLDTIRDLLVVVPITLEAHERSQRVAERYGFSTYDSLIVASALIEQVDILWSEDMQDGMLVDGTLRIVDPFRLPSPLLV